MKPMSREIMLERMYASDKNYNGYFITGVLSTGIYCLPSCNARKPKAENVRFFLTEEEAKEAGLRACLRCRPDAFYRNHDPDLEPLLELVAEIRKTPSHFTEIQDMAERAGFGITKLNALFRHHYHTTPALFLNQSRINSATRLLREQETATMTALEIAFEVGYESLSAFNENFRRLMALTPSEYRKLGRSNAFTLQLPDDYRPEYALRHWDRDPQSNMERVEQNRITKVIQQEGQIGLLHLTLEAEQAHVSLETGQPVTPALMRMAHTIALRLLGLGGDSLGFERKLEQKPDLLPLLGTRRGLRIPLSPTPFEALAWAIIGQQINLSFAYTLRRSLAELCGTRFNEPLIAHPTPEQVARLDPADLRGHQFSQRKAEYLIDTARLIASHDLPLEDFWELPVPQTEKQLLKVRGLGPWSVNYLLMRGYGFADCVPLGDSGLRTALRRFYKLESPPDTEQTLKLMEPFAPYRSLATYHLWMTLGENL